MRLRVSAPGWGRLPMLFAALLAAVMCALSVPALAQPKKKPPKKPPAPIEKPVDKPDKEKPDTDNTADKDKDKDKDKEKPDATAAPAADTKPGKKIKEQTFNFEGLGLAGRNRSPQLLYFLERANEELERASLEKRSFIPHMVRSLEEEAL
jgi:hypothetical protein